MAERPVIGWTVKATLEYNHPKLLEGQDPIKLGLMAEVPEGYDPTSWAQACVQVLERGAKSLFPEVASRRGVTDIGLPPEGHEAELSEGLEMVLSMPGAIRAFEVGKDRPEE